ncbi:sulfite exporter TauE/SafE family protein [Pararhodobacter oceanensis]|nr:sulfite exporter TauE/SafE family protein [Pararhodobacter oceanensis]
MEIFLGGLSPSVFAMAFGVTLMAGIVKGAIGFALPLIMIAVLPSFMPAQTALAALILPVVVANAHQSVRFGFHDAWVSAKAYWRIIALTLVGIAISAPFAVVLPQYIMFLLLGSAVMIFSVLQLTGWKPDIPEHRRNPIQYALGLIGGLYGGISGVWGPPVIVYLLATKTPKREMVCIMSVIFTVGGVMLLAMHLQTGLLNAQTLPLSLAMLVPSTLGLFLGYMVQDRLDAEKFRRYALIMLSISALNLLRRGFLG